MTKSKTKREKLAKASEKYKKDIFGNKIKKLIEKIRFEDEYKDIPIEIIEGIQYIWFKWLYELEGIESGTAYKRLDGIEKDFLHPLKHLELTNLSNLLKVSLTKKGGKPLTFISLTDGILFTSMARGKIKKIEVLRKVLFEFEDINRTIKALLNNREDVYITLDGIAYQEICSIQIRVKGHDQYEAYKLMQGRPIWETIRLLKYEELRLTQKNVKPFRCYSLHHPYTKPEESYKDIYPHVATRGRLILTGDHKPGANNE